MNVKIVIEGSQEEKDLAKFPIPFFVEQANARAVINQKSYCHIRGNCVKALVPACAPNVVSQVPVEDIANLIACYASCICDSARAGAMTIIIKPLGVGIKLTRMSASGRELPNGLWGNLFWNQTKTSLAARKAIDESFSLVQGDVMVVFVVPPEAFDDWDVAMQFTT